MRVLRTARLADFTTFRIGGPCSRLIECVTAEDLRSVISNIAQEKTSFVLIGGGSNLLVSDEGIPGTVVRYAGSPVKAEKMGDTWRVNGSVMLDELIAWMIDEGYAGLECMSGIPGTVGGAVAGNAGAFGRQIAELLVSVELLAPNGMCREVAPAQLAFAYRSSRLQRTKEIVLAVRLRLEKGDRSRLREERQRVLALRKERHPDWHICPTAGSFFKNLEPAHPTERRQPAGWFLEQAGAKAMRVGRARVFEKHANIIVAEAGATSSEVWQLARQMAQAVWEKFHIRLAPEVRILGRFTPVSLLDA